MAIEQCRQVIDWVATGTMMQGWGTLLGAVAVIYAARKGVQTFESWKRQKLAERHLEQAERILTAIYRARRALEEVRSPMLWPYESSVAEETLKLDPQWALQDAIRKKRLITAQAYYNRINRSKEERQELESCQPTARALFGQDLEKHLEEINHQFRIVQIDVDSYIEDNGNDPEFSKQIRQSMYATMSKKREDPIANKVDEEISKIEEICFPILRMDHKPSAP